MSRWEVEHFLKYFQQEFQVSELLCAEDND